MKIKGFPQNGGAIKMDLSQEDFLEVKLGEKRHPHQIRCETSVRGPHFMRMIKKIFIILFKYAFQPFEEVQILC